MPHKLFEFLIRHFDVVRTSTIHKANYLAFDLKNEETIRIDLYPLGYLFEGCRFVAFISSCLDFKASNCVGGLGVSKFIHALNITSDGSSCIAAVGSRCSVGKGGLSPGVCRSRHELPLSENGHNFASPARCASRALALIAAPRHPAPYAADPPTVSPPIITVG